MDSELKRLERQYRRMITFVVVMIPLMALLGAAYTSPSAQVDTKSLVIRDDLGKVRCRIECDKDGSVVQTMYDSASKPRVKVMVDKESVARVRLYDDDINTPRVGLYAYPKKHDEVPQLAGVNVVGPDEKCGISNIANAKNEVFHQVYDRNGDRLRSYVNPDGESGFVQWDKNGKNRFWSASLADGESFARWFDAEEKSRFSMTTRDKWAFYTQADSDGKVRIRFQTSDNGIAKQEMLTPDGVMRAALISNGNTCAQVYTNDKGDPKIGLGTYKDEAHCEISAQGSEKLLASAGITKPVLEALRLLDSK